MFVIMTDRFISGGVFSDAGGTLPPVAIMEWNNKGGLRSFYSEDVNGEILVHTFEDAKKFETMEDAEAVAFKVCLTLPPLIGHIGVYDEGDAGHINTRETLEWMVTQDEMRQKMKEKCPS
jgi:hypothetical protein